MKHWFVIFAMLAFANVAGAAPRHRAAPKPRAFPLQLKNKLVFTRGEPAVHFMVPASESVWTMNADGSGQKQVWRVPKGYGRFGGFNRVGTQALSYNGFNLYLHDLKTRRLRRLFLHSEGWGTYIASTSFSPDGKRVVFAAGNKAAEYHSQIYVLDLQHPPRTMKAMQELRITLPQDASGDVYEPRFSPDGQRLAVYVATRPNDPGVFTGDPWNIWTLGSDGSSPRRVTSNPSPLKNLSTLDQTPCFSPDGQTIAFVRRVFQKDKGDSNDVWLVNADGQNERSVTTYEEAAKTADAKEFKSWRYNIISNLFFSSDGQQIAFNQMGREDGIYRVDVDGTNLKRLTGGTLVQWAW